MNILMQVVAILSQELDMIRLVMVVVFISNNVINHSVGWDVDGVRRDVNGVLWDVRATSVGWDVTLRGTSAVKVEGAMDVETSVGWGADNVKVEGVEDVETLTE
jgi:hypothetical protein